MARFRTCAVASCPNSMLPAHKIKNSCITYHAFPRQEKLSNLWIKACRSNVPLNPDTSKVCSIHFLRDDFKAYRRIRSLNHRTGRLLKPQAIPKRFLKECSPDISTQVASRQQHEKDNIVKNEIIPTQKIEDKPLEEGHHVIKESLEDKYNKLFSDHEKLRTKYKHLAELKRNQKNRIIILNKKINLLSQKPEKQTGLTHCFEDALKTIFSKTQLSFITKQ